MKIIHASTENAEFSRQVLVSDYYEKGWTHILTPSKNTVQLVDIAKSIANNNLVGYSQAKRNTLYDFLKNHKVSEINEKLYCDCSSFVDTCMALSGLVVYNGATTRDMIERYSSKCSIKQFRKEDLRDGDIILKVGSHCGIICESGKSHQKNFPTIKIGQAMVVADTLRVRKEPNGEQIKSLVYGNIVNIKDTQNGWSHITYRDIDGWVASKFLENI